MAIRSICASVIIRFTDVAPAGVGRLVVTFAKLPVSFSVLRLSTPIERTAAALTTNSLGLAKIGILSLVSAPTPLIKPPVANFCAPIAATCKAVLAAIKPSQIPEAIPKVKSGTAKTAVAAKAPLIKACAIAKRLLSSNA